MGSGRRSGLLQSGLSWGFSRRCFSSVAVATPGMGLCTAAVMTKDAAVATEGMPSVVILPTMCRKNEAIFSSLWMHRLLVEVCCCGPPYIVRYVVERYVQIKDGGRECRGQYFDGRRRQYMFVVYGGKEGGRESVKVEEGGGSWRLHS